MAFKMKGFPYSGKSPVKDVTRGPAVEGNHNYAHLMHKKGKGPDPHEGEDDPSALKQTVTTDSKVVDKDKEMEISIRKMISKPNWNSGKKRSDYTAAELANVRNPKYQAMLSKIVQEEIDEKGDGSDKSGDNEGE